MSVSVMASVSALESASELVLVSVSGAADRAARAAPAEAQEA